VNPQEHADGSLNLAVSYTVTNATDRPVTYKFTSGKQFDAWVLANGKEIARESRGKFYTQALTSFALQPGQSKTYNANLPIDAQTRKSANGNYEFHAGLVGQKNMGIAAKVTVKDGAVTVTPPVVE
jgi:hypothetical protein